MDPLQIEVLQQRYKGEWLAIEVTGTDRHGIAREGVVIAHSQDKDVVLAALRESAAKHVSVLYVGTIPIGVDGVMMVGDLPIRS